MEPCQRKGILILPNPTGGVKKTSPSTLAQGIQVNMCARWDRFRDHLVRKQGETVRDGMTGKPPCTETL